MQFSIPVSVRLDKELFSKIKKWSKTKSLGVGAGMRFLLAEALRLLDVETPKQ